MAEFSPFRGLRYDLDRLGAGLDAVAAPPYDVVDDEHRVGFEANHPANAIRLILPQDERDAGDRYGCAARALAEWHAAGVLTRDATARFYGYRMDFVDPHGVAAHTIGVLGALALPDRAGEGDILPHERTIPKAKSDRLDLLRATRANLDPIWGLSPADGLTDLIDTSTALAECHDEHGVRHRLFAIDNPDRVAAIEAAIAAHPLVLADGHHRFETAINYRNEQRAAGASDPGADAIMCLVVELTEHELCIQAIHRLVTVDVTVDVLSALRDAFTIRDAGPNTPEGVDALESLMHAEHGIGLAFADTLHLLVPHAAVCEPALIASEPEAVRATDAALVEAVVVPRLPDAQWRYRHALHDVAMLVGKGEATFGLLLKPVGVADTRAAAVAGVRMPQKTTFFYPKPRTGMVFRLLD